MQAYTHLAEDFMLFVFYVGFRQLVNYCLFVSLFGVVHTKEAEVVGTISAFWRGVFVVEGFPTFSWDTTPANTIDARSIAER